MKKIIIFPAILSKTYKDYVYKIRESAKYFDGVQIDVMDGQFVKAKTYRDMKKIRELRPKKLFFDIHLMVHDPIAGILEWADIGDRFLVHVESCDNGKAVVQLVKGLNKKLGLVVNPKTPVSRVYPYLTELDAVMVMSVVPGKSGQKFIPSVLKKVKALKQKKVTFHIAIDGGINDRNIKDAVKAGVDTIAVGSYLWGSEPLGTLKQRLMQAL